MEARPSPRFPSEGVTLVRGIRTVASLAAIGSVFAASTGAAAAADNVVSDYKPNVTGYKPSVLYNGTTCNPGLSCPGVTNSVEPSGGTSGGAFLRTALSSPVSASADSSGIWGRVYCDG